MDAAQGPSYPPLGVAAKGILQRADGRVLLIRRSTSSRTDPGRWDLPGGKMDFGERLVDALVREVREETGLAVTAGRPIHLSHFVREPFWVTCVTFLCTDFSGEVRLSHEHEEHAWVAPDELAGLDYSRAIREQLEALLEREDETPSVRPASRSG